MALFAVILLFVLHWSMRPAASECTDGFKVISVNNASSCDKTHTTCLNGSVACCTLEGALQAGVPPCSRVVVDTNQTFNGNVVVNGSHDLVLQQNGSTLITVSCSGNLSFTNCQNVNISGIQFQTCSLTFLDCVNVSVTGASFSSGPAVGLALIDVSGSATISTTQFIDHGNQQKPAVGLLIHKQLAAKPGKFQISNCTFSSNTNADVSNIDDEVLDRAVYKSCTGYYGGRGGGLVILVDGSGGNVIELVKNVFKNNTGCIGGGAYVSISGNASSADANVLNIANVTFESNFAYKLGGGLYLDDGDNSSTVNTALQIVITRTIFDQNNATNAAGLAYKSIGELPFPTNYTVQLSECNFTNNTANDTGGAFGFYRSSSDYDIDDKPITVQMENCLVQDNSIYHRFTGRSIVLGIGVIYTEGVNIAFSGTTPGTHIEHNYGTAILASSAWVAMNGSVDITNNRGIRGGAVYLVGSSRFVVGKGLNLKFSDNYAQLYGGAVFHSYPALGVGQDRYCIFEYNQKSIINPADWLANISFTNNTAGISGNAIFFSSPASCFVSNTSNEVSTYHFVGIEPQVTSSPIRLEFTSDNCSAANPTVMLGELMKLKVIAYDIFNNSVNAPMMVSLACKDQPDEQCPYTLAGTTLVQVNASDTNTTNKMTTNLERTTFFIKGPEPSNDRVTLMWQTLENGPVSLAFLDVNIRQCRFGYVYSDMDQRCVCFNSPHVYCDEASYTSCVEEGYWFGEVNNDSTYIAVPCPFGNCNYTGGCPTDSCAGKPFFCTLYDEDLDALCYGNRSGILCSQCKHNANFAFDAIQCNTSDQLTALWSILLVLVFWLALCVALLVIVRLDFHIGSGQLYCFLFFFTVLQYFVGGTFPFIELYHIELVVTGFIQLNPKFFGLIPSISFPPDFNMWFNVLSYVHPLFLGCVIMLLVCCARKYHLPFLHERRGINAICILLYLSFFSLSQTSLSFIAPITFSENITRASIEPKIGYFKVDHRDKDTIIFLTFTIIAILVQVTLVIPFLCLLIFSPLMIRFSIFDKLVQRLKPIIDEFQACYKDNCRPFAGFYLTWRQIIFFIGLIEDNFVTIYLLQISSIIMLLVLAIFQPYKKQWLNALDALFVTDLILLSILHGSTANKVFATNSLAFFKKVIVTCLVLFPLVYFILLCLSPIAKRAYSFIFRKKQKQLHDFTEHTADEREPILFEQSGRYTNKSESITGSVDAPVNVQPTTTVVGISSTASYQNSETT